MMIMLHLIILSIVLFSCNAIHPDELEEYFDYGGVEYGPVGGPDFWLPGDPVFLLKSATCTQCPRTLRPPKPCTRCSSDDGCGSNKTCCPFITLSTAAKACTSEQKDNCRLTNEIQVDFLRRACSCVRQIKCCVSTASIPATIAPPPVVIHNATTTTRKPYWTSTQTAKTTTEKTDTTEMHHYQ